MLYRCALIGLLILHCVESTAQESVKPDSESRLILAHYMPWYVAKPHSQVWGWHWTMNHFDPEQEKNGKRQIASHFYPLIGPYDSGDPAVVEYHLLLMKLAGIDGVIVDWYGLQDFRDYAILHRNTQQLVDQVNRLGMKFVICYEDQTIPIMAKAGRINDRVGHAVSEIEWLQRNWFTHKSYVRSDDRPVLLSFGQAGLTNDEWSACVKRLPSPPVYFSEHNRRDSAAGAFDWPIPSQGLQTVDQFQLKSQQWQHSIPVAFPRFVDVYAAAKLHDGYGRIDDQKGTTFKTTLEKALKSSSHIIQVATWNDWGEGTVIEPSREYGYRDLEAIQEMRRRHLDPQFKTRPTDLRLAMRVYQHRRRASVTTQTKQLDRIALLIASGQHARAETELRRLPLGSSRTN